MANVQLKPSAIEVEITAGNRRSSATVTVHQRSGIEAGYHEGEQKKNLAMSLGFAAIAWVPPTPPMFIVAADSRISLGDGNKSNAGIKTYELGGRTAAVVAGSALQAIHAAETVRTIVENHNRRTPGRRGFYDTTRLFAFFLKRAADSQGAACEIALAGFLNSQVPVLALVHASSERNRVVFQSVEQGEKVALAVGAHEGSTVLIQGLAVMQREGKPMVALGLSLLW